MLFTSMEFLFLFFPIVLGVYFFLPMKARNYWLFLVSLFFYAWGEPVFVLFMLFSIFFNYLVAIRIEELGSKGCMRKIMLAIAVFVNLGVLFVYKYMNFATTNLQKLFESSGFAIEITEYAVRLVLPAAHCRTDCPLHYGYERNRKPSYYQGRLLSWYASLFVRI